MIINYMILWVIKLIIVVIMVLLVVITIYSIYELIQANKKFKNWDKQFDKLDEKLKK